MALPDPWRPAPSGQVFESGQAHVFHVSRADDPADYALKRLKNPNREGRFYREVETMRALAEEGVSVIPPVIDSGRDQDSRPYFVMPWYSEGSLEGVVQKGGFLDRLTDGMEFLLALAKALESVHQAGWAHRDLKPANVLLDFGRPLLADLGLTMSVEAAVEDRLTGSQEAIGSRLYIAPENESGFNEDQDQRPADFYAFAKVAWAILVGRAPPSRERQIEPGSRLVEMLSDPKLGGLDGLLELLLRTDPRARLQAWEPVIAEFYRVLETLEGTTVQRDVGSLEDEASEAARQYAQSSSGVAARIQRERSEKQNRRFGEIRLALQSGLETFRDRYDELTQVTRGSMQLVVSQGHPPLSELLSLGVLGDAGVDTDFSKGLPASLNEGANLVLVAPIDGPLPPPAYLAGYVYVDTRTETVWLVRVPLIFSMGPRQLHLLAPLRERFFDAVGPLPLEAESTVERARSFGQSIGMDGLELASDYLRHVTEGHDILEPATWR